eukprot:scaffold20587_cov110-Isochrysis_galbana.AAC.14
MADGEQMEGGLLRATAGSRWAGGHFGGQVRTDWGHNDGEIRRSGGTPDGRGGSKVGALIYPVPCTRPDLAPSVGYLARALTFPTSAMNDCANKR